MLSEQGFQVRFFTKTNQGFAINKKYMSKIQSKFLFFTIALYLTKNRPTQMHMHNAAMLWDIMVFKPALKQIGVI